MTKKNKIIAAVCSVAVIAIIAIVIVVVVINNKGGNGIVGKWKYSGSEFSSLGVDFVYTFNADGTGDYDMSGTKMSFTYIIDGDKLTINYNSSSAPFETEYEIKDNVLNVKDSGGNDTFYKRI